MNQDEFIPDTHPRAQSLRIRHRLIQGFHANVVAEAGLIAHGRGEAYDYLLKEKTHDFAKQAIQAGVAMLLLAKHPVLSVNGNVASLVPHELVKLSEATNAPLEINLFYRTREREEAIYRVLKEHGAKDVLGYDLAYRAEIQEITHNRRIVDSRGIKIADVVFVPLEDGDRTMALRALQKSVITVDLNPISRTSIHSSITIVDNIVRAVPLMVEYAESMKSWSKAKLQETLSHYNHEATIRKALQRIVSFAQSYEFPL